MTDQKLTCKDCIALNEFKDPQAIGVVKYQCIRHPPKIIPINTPQGLQIISMYPPIAPDMVACCDALIDDEDEDDIPTLNN